MEKVVVYRASDHKGNDHREKKKPRRFPFWRLAVVLGIALVLILTAPFIFLEVQYKLRQVQAEEEDSGFGRLLAKIRLEEGSFGGIIKIIDLETLNPVDPQFSIVIPKIGVNSLVLPQVPTSDEKTWREALAQGVAHAAGSHLPDEKGTVMIFGHSTDYIWNVSRFNAAFYLLKELEPADPISLFYQENRFEYEVVSKEVVGVKEIEKINASLDEDRLVLQTCWPPGTTWKRLLIYAKRA